MPRGGMGTGVRAWDPCSLTQSRQRFSRLLHGPHPERESRDCRKVSTFAERRYLARYPYQLADLVADDEVHVLAGARDRRRPTYWTDRT